MEQKVTSYGSKRTLGYMSLAYSTLITHRRSLVNVSRMLLLDRYLDHRRTPSTWAGYPPRNVLRFYRGQAVSASRLENPVRIIIYPHLKSIVTERLRPLPKEMLAYARSDTHFLLYIYDNLRNALLDRASSRPQSPTSETPQLQADIGSPRFGPRHSLLRDVLSRSEETSLRLHLTENYDDEEGTGPGGWDTIARKWNRVAFTNVAYRSIPKSIYLRIHDWRDRVAREEDESTAYALRWGLSSITFTHMGCRYILPQHYLFQLAEQPPNDLPALLNIFRAVPPVIKRRANELLDEIRVGGSGSKDISGAQKIVADLGQSNDTKPVETPIQGDFQNGSGMVLYGPLLLETYSWGSSRNF